MMTMTQPPADEEQEQGRQNSVTMHVIFTKYMIYLQQMISKINGCQRIKKGDANEDQGTKKSVMRMRKSDRAVRQCVACQRK
jgi:hypothetical protein